MEGGREEACPSLCENCDTHTKVYDGNRLAVIASQYHYWIVISTHIVKDDNDHKFCMMYTYYTAMMSLFVLCSSAPPNIRGETLFLKTIEFLTALGCT